MYNNIYLEFKATGGNNPTLMAIRDRNGPKISSLSQLGKGGGRTTIEAIEASCGNLMFNLMENDQETNKR